MFSIPEGPQMPSHDLGSVQTLFVRLLLTNMLLMKLMLLQTVNLQLVELINIIHYEYIERLALLVRIPAVPDFSLAPETRYPD
jgi:hypothetical protein